jgi:hypothetical protein
MASPMARLQQKAGGSHHRFSRVNRHSLRDGVNKLLRARPGETGFCVTVVRGIIDPQT